jgi:hypothetical protein
VLACSNKLKMIIGFAQIVAAIGTGVEIEWPTKVRAHSLWPSLHSKRRCPLPMAMKSFAAI